MKLLAYHSFCALGEKLRVIPILGLFFLALSTHAQTPDYFGNNPIWTGNRWWDDASQLCSNDFQFAYYLDGTVTFDSIEYHVLRERGNFSQQSITGGMFDCTTNYNYNNIAAYLRQEGRKIYRFLGGQDTLMIDYEVSIGDTMHGQIMDGAVSIFKDSVVTAIDSILINGEYRRRYYFDTVMWGAANPVVVEGIGNFAEEGWSQGEFINPTMGQGMSTGENIFCYGLNDTTYWTYDSIIPGWCNFYVSVPKAPDRIQLRTFPNPCQGTLQVLFESGLNVDVIQIQNTLGQQLLRNEVSSDLLHEIDLSTFGPGVYLCNVYSKNQLLGTERIVVR